MKKLDIEIIKNLRGTYEIRRPTRYQDFWDALFDRNANYEYYQEPIRDTSRTEHWWTKEFRQYSTKYNQLGDARAVVKSLIHVDEVVLTETQIKEGMIDGLSN